MFTWIIHLWFISTSDRTWFFSVFMWLFTFVKLLHLLEHVSNHCSHDPPSLVYHYLYKNMFLISAHVTIHLLFTSTSIRTCFLSVFMWLYIFSLSLPLNISVHMALHLWFISTSVKKNLFLISVQMAIHHWFTAIPLQCSCDNSSLDCLYLC